MLASDSMPFRPYCVFCESCLTSNPAGTIGWNLCWYQPSDLKEINLDLTPNYSFCARTFEVFS